MATLEDVFTQLVQLGFSLREADEKVHTLLLQRLAEEVRLNNFEELRSQALANYERPVVVEAENEEGRRKAEEQARKELRNREQEEADILQAWRREEDSRLEKRLSHGDIKVHVQSGSVSNARAAFQQRAQPAPSSPKPAAAQQPSRPIVKRAPSERGAGGKVDTPVGGNECDLSDPAIAEAYQQMRDDNGPINWMLLDYGDSRKQLRLLGTGNGGLQECVEHLGEDVMYAYLKVIHGDSNRTKFVFVTYVPDTLSGLKKAKANMHKPSVERYLKYYHTQVQAVQRADLHEAIVRSKLDIAGGANYGTGSGGGKYGGENFSGIKDLSKNFFKSTEQKGSGVSIVYNKGPLSETTPVNLKGRAGITEKYIKVLDGKLVDGSPEQAEGDAAEQAPVEQVPVEQAPVEQAPVEQAPVEAEADA